MAGIGTKQWSHGRAVSPEFGLNGHATLPAPRSFEHDTAGRINAVIAPDGGRTALEYAANGELVRTTDPLGRSTERIFDELGNVTAAVLPDGARWGFTHDTLSRLTGITDPAGHDWVREYDKVGALTAVVDPTGMRIDASTDRQSGTATIRDAFSAATYSFDGVGGRTRFEYDSRGRLVRITDPTGGVTVRSYTDGDHVESVTDPLGRVTTATYDPAGRQLSQTDPDGNTTAWTYDAAGREKSTSWNRRPRSRRGTWCRNGSNGTAATKLSARRARRGY